MDPPRPEPKNALNWISFWIRNDVARLATEGDIIKSQITFNRGKEQRLFFFQKTNTLFVSGQLELSCFSLRERPTDNAAALDLLVPALSR